MNQNNHSAVLMSIVALLIGGIVGYAVNSSNSIPANDQTGASARTSVVSEATNLTTPTSTPTVKELISSGKVKLLSLADSQSVLSKMKLTFALPPADGSNRLIYYGCPGFTGVMVWDTNGFTTAEIFGWATGLLQSHCMIYGYTG